MESKLLKALKKGCNFFFSLYQLAYAGESDFLCTRKGLKLVNLFETPIESSQKSKWSFFNTPLSCISYTVVLDGHSIQQYYSKC